MDDGPRGAVQRFEGALDELFPALDEHLDGYVVGDEVGLDDLALEVEVGLGGGGEAHLDLLEADLDQGPEEGQLALGVHRVDEGLVPVSEVDARPPRGLGRLSVGPRAVGEHERTVGAIEVEGHGRDVTGHLEPAAPPPPAVPCFVALFRSSLSCWLWLLMDWLLVAIARSLPAGPTGRPSRPDACGRTGVSPMKKPPGRMAQEVAGEHDGRSPSGKEQVRAHRHVHGPSMVPGQRMAVKDGAPCWLRRAALCRGAEDQLPAPWRPRAGGFGKGTTLRRSGGTGPSRRRTIRPRIPATWRDTLPQPAGGDGETWGSAGCSHQGGLACPRRAGPLSPRPWWSRSSVR